MNGYMYLYKAFYTLFTVMLKSLTTMDGVKCNLPKQKISASNIIFPQILGKEIEENLTYIDL